MRSFAHRSTEAEWIDAPDATAADIAANLADIAQVNTLTLARSPTLRWLARATTDLPGRAFSLLDVGFGQGDLLRAIHGWAVKAGFAPSLTGVDLSPHSAPAARAVTDPAFGIDYRTGDVFDYAPQTPIDFVVSSQVTHHLTDDQLVRLLRWLEARAERGWFISDLHRHPAAFYGFKAIAGVAPWHPWIRHDGAISVARAFRVDDWERLVERAGVPRDRVTIERRFPFRICVGRRK